MAAVRFKVTYVDETVREVRVSPKAQVLFERHFKLTVSDAARNTSAEHLYYQAWAALHCAGMESNDFETFLGLISDVDPADTPEDAADPTRKAPGPEPLSS